jgi:hypothetical protein
VNIVVSPLWLPAQLHSQTYPHPATEPPLNNHAHFHSLLNPPSFSSSQDQGRFFMACRPLGLAILSTSFSIAFCTGKAIAAPLLPPSLLLPLYCRASCSITGHRSSFNGVLLIYQYMGFRIVTKTYSCFSKIIAQDCWRDGYKDLLKMGKPICWCSFPMPKHANVP